MGRFVLSDAAPLISLSQVDGLPWLKSLFGRVHITLEVRDEIITGADKPGEDKLARAIKRKDLRVHRDWKWRDPQSPDLGPGEASCIRTALHLTRRGHECLLLMDDLEARRRASSLSIAITGMAAVVGAARQCRLIASAREVFALLREKGFRVSDEIVQGVLESVGEHAVRKPPLKSATSGR